MIDNKIPNIKELLEYEAKVGCQHCDLIGKGICSTCVNSLIKSFIGLFDRLQEDLEETKKRNQDLEYAFQGYKAEAYKEFAERLKTKGFIILHHKMILSSDVDNLLKEMKGK